jgi:Zn-dependent M28 family amino/carboxypeptidase
MAANFDRTGLEQRLRQHVETLARTPRVPGTAEHFAAEDYIRRHLSQAGFQVSVEHFQEAGFVGANLLTEPRPTTTNLPLLIVGAHYDSVQQSPGADDNASAVAALLELAAWIGPTLGTTGRTRLQLVAYDLEEYGMVGSHIHCRRLHHEGVALRGMISLEMLGFIDSKPGSQRLPQALAHLYPDVGNFIGIVGNENSRSLLGTVTAAMKLSPGLPVQSLAVPGNGESFFETRLSDHSAFWDHGYEALMITDTSFFRNPHYHQRTDTPDTLDYAFLAKVTEGVCKSVEALLAGA